ncbi:MAG: transporter substrate-binding domain-containing protein [Kiloniellaceae bacterium]|nr:transporter substrate-binding domain-containing protein [Kiloniellaceae bacterium]
MSQSSSVPLFLALFLVLGVGQARAEVALTEAEAAWRQDHPSVSVAMDSDYAPINYLDAGLPVGIAVDLLRLVESKSGLTINWLADRWPVVIDHAMSHRVDAVINADKTAERQARLIYTRPYYQVPQAVAVRDDVTGIATPAGLATQTVAVLAGTSQIDYLQRHHPNVRVIEAETMLSMVSAVLSGEADMMIAALPVVHHFMSENLIAGLRISGVFQSDEIDNLHIAVRNDAPELRAILDKAIADITREERQQIMERWLPTSVLREHTAPVRPAVELSQAEKDWIMAHPVIRVAGDRAWPPIEFVTEEGRFDGLSADYLRRIGELVGLRFEFDLEAGWAEAVAKLRNRELDMFSAAAETPERLEFARFTQPYLTLPAMIFARDSETFVDGLQGLAGRRVASVESYAVTEFLRGKQEGYDFDLVEVADAGAGLRALAANEVDVYVGSILVTGYHLRRESVSNIMVVGDLPFQIKVAMAARSDWPELQSILIKALNAITAEERNTFNSRWMSLQIGRMVDYAMVWRWAVAGALVLMLFIAWNWYLQRKTSAQSAELRRKNQELEMEVEVRRRAEEEALVATQSKSRLLANMSHELRTPLNAIIGFSDLLHSNGLDAFPETRRVEYAGHIHSAGRHLLNLVNDTLDLSAVEAGHMTLNEETFTLASLLDNVMPMLEQRSKDAGVELLRVQQAGGLRIHGDERRLRQVIINLIDNAIKFTPAGGRVVVSQDSDEGARAGVTVVDNGIGMSPAQVTSAFRAFERGTDPFVRASEGVGLGLALSSEILKAHGGEIEMVSRPGEGTTATLWLPSERVLPDSARCA